MIVRRSLIVASVLALIVASALLTAQAPQPPTNVTVNAPGIWTLTPGSASIVVGSTVQIASSSGSGTTWISNNPSVASVSQSGLVTGVGVGTTTILARKDNKNGQTIITVSIAPQPPAGDINVPYAIQEALYPGSTAGVARTNEPVTFSVPFPDDAVTGAANAAALGLTGATVGQFRTLSTWASGRVQWALVDTIVPSFTAGSVNTTIAVVSGSGNFGGSNLATDNGSTITIATGAATFTLKKANFNGFDSVVIGSTTVVSTGTSEGFTVLGPSAAGSYPANVTCTPTSGGAACTVPYSSSNDAGSTAEIEENGPVRTVIKATYDLEDASHNVYLRGTARIHFYRNKTYTKLVSVLRNAEDGTTASAATAYKGHRGYEFRTTLALGASPNIFTIANHTGTPTTGTLQGVDSAYLFQGISTIMQFEDNPVAYQISDSGYAIAKNGVTLQTGTSGQRTEGWCDIANAAGIGVEVGTYQSSGSYPKGCTITSGGNVMAIGILGQQSTTPYYMEWPQWDEYTTNFVNFHATFPASVSNDFLRFQHALVGRADDFAYYNTAAVLPTPLLDPLVEDTYTTTVSNSGNPSINTSSKWATNNATRAQDFGVIDTTFALTIVRSFSWNLESEYRYGYMLNWLTRGMTGRLLQARHFYEHHLAYMLPHSDGFDWRTGHTSVINGFGEPTIVSGNSTLGTHGANEHNWRDQEHGFWYGMMLYYALSGDEFMHDAMIDQQKDWFLTPNTYQQGGAAGIATVSTSGTAATKTAGSSWTNTLVGQQILIGTSKDAYEVVSVADTTHATLATSAGTRTNDPFVIFNGLFNARSLATQLVGGDRFSEFLRGIGDSDATNVLTSVQHVIDEQIKAKGCMNGYPANCLIGGTNNEDVSGFKSQGIHRERGPHWGSAGNSGNYCGVAHTYRVNSLFQEALMSEAVLEFAAYRGTGYADYDLLRDLAYGISQWALNEGWYGGTSSQATDGFRGGMAFDTRNDCQETTDLWDVNISGTAVTRNSGPNFVTNGNWTSAYAIMYDGTSAFVCGGIPRLIASVTNASALVLQSATGNGTNVSCYWREENYDEAYSNGALTDWPHYFSRYVVAGETSWETKFKLSMQRSMAINGLSFRDLLGHLISRTIKYLTDGSAPLLTNVTITNVTDNGGGSYTLTWAPLTGGQYRVKWSPKTIVDLIGFNSDTNAWTGNPATQMNWSGATNVTTVPICGATCTVTVATGTNGLVTGNFSVKGTGSAVPTSLTTVAWTNQTHTTGWPGYNGFLEWAGFDPISRTPMLYGIPSTSSSIYSTNWYSYGVTTNLWTLLGGNNHTGNNCVDTWPGFPPDRHPVGQMAVDTLRNRLWMVGGVCSGVDRQDMAYLSLNANPLLDAWTQVTISPVPTALNSGSLVYDSATDALLLFGPNSGSILQVWIYCPSAALSGAQTTAGCVSPQTWVQVSFSGGPYLGDAFAKVAYSAVRNQTVIFGGLDNSSPTNQLWTYTTATKTFAQRCAGACTPPPIYNGPASPPTFAFVEIPSASTWFFHQTFNTGAPRDWTFTFGASAALDVWALVSGTGSGPSRDSVAVYDSVQNTVVLFTRNPSSGTADVWQGAIK